MSLVAMRLGSGDVLICHQIIGNRLLYAPLTLPYACKRAAFSHHERNEL